MLDETLEKIKNSIIEKQGRDKIHWGRAAQDIGMPKTTLWQMFEDDKSPTWKNLSKVSGVMRS